MPWVSRLRVVSSPAAARSGVVAGRAHVHLIAPSWCIAVLKKKREDEESGCQLLDGRQRTEEGGRVFAQSFTLLSPSLSSSSPLRSTAPSLLKGRSERARNIRLVNSPPPARILLSPSRTGCLWIGSYNLLNLLKLGLCPQILKQQQTPASYYPTLPNPRPVNLRSHRGIASEDGDDPIGGPAPRSSPRRSLPRSLARSVVPCRLKLPSGE